MFFSAINLEGQSLSQIHSWIANFDSNAVWQKVKNTIYVVSKTQFTNATKVLTEYPKGSVLRFSWRLHPATRNTYNGKTREKRVDHEHMGEFIDRKAEQNGFSIIDCRVRDEPSAYLEHKDLFLWSSLVYGELRVEDPEKFRIALEEGVRGSGKRCFGFSMLNIWKS